MNKKIFTLAAALGLASVVSTSVLAADLTAGERNVTKFEVGKVYQLGDATAAKVLVMVSDGANGYTLKLKDVTGVTDLKSTLWKVTPTFNSHAAGPDFAFVNEATGLPLTADPAKAHVYNATKTYAAADGQVKMSGSTSSWKWQAVTETTPEFGANGLLSYFTKDSVVTLVTGDAFNAGSQSSDDVYLVKAAASGTWAANHLELAPITAGAVTLSALDLNTKMLTDPKGSSFNLSSDKTTSANSKLGNVFRDKTFRAWNMGDASWPAAVAANKANFIQYVSDPLKVGGSGSVGVADHVFLQIIDKDVNEDDPFKDTYLLADTAYIDGTANNLALVKFGTDKIVSAVSAGNGFLDKATAGRDIQSYMFKFTYYPTSDSIAISVKSYKKKKATGDAEDVNGKDTKWDVATTGFNVVTLNKLTEVTEITLTAADPAANVRFYLGAGNDNRSSQDNGLFYIQNGKGQYLSVPINEAGYNEAKWVTVKGGEQAVAHMPAYQWVVLKNLEQSATIKAISSLNVANREFPGVKEVALQLYKDAGATYQFAATAANGLFAATDSLTFTQIKDEAVLNNATLGYLDLEDNVLDVMTYKLNYLHPYATNKFVGMDSDSLLSVKDAETAFFMKESAKANYGYIVTTAVANKIAGLKQLTRVKYTPYVKTASGDLYMAMNDESRYYLTHEASEKKTFYLKENNHYQPEGAPDARHYYALIDLNSDADSTKVGTTDDDMAAILKNQVLHETRTSSFAVLPNDAPLYRRFNTALEGREADDETTVFLRFKELYRGEYLMDENNKSFKNEAVDYAGIERPDKATGLSFMVDTAIVTETTFGEIKPQYFIYVNKEVKDAVPTIACDATNHKHLDANGKETTADKCSHATPAKAGFVKAKYLVSFADSLSAKDANKLYKFGKYTRVGFVDGLHIGDSLYILVNGFENKALADLDTADIKAAYKKAGITNKIINLKAERTDKHHNYTWSFRFISPEKAANVTEESKDVAFLIESAGNADIAPTKGAWLKSQNGCLVLSDATDATFANAKTGGDNALIFNIEVGNDDELATDTETIAPSAVSVIASEGQVTIAGAQGKKVVVSNILGQTIANTVITSSTATIAVPAGVVVVAIEGETAVKAIVK